MYAEKCWRSRRFSKFSNNLPKNLIIHIEGLPWQGSGEGAIERSVREETKSESRRELPTRYLAGAYGGLDSGEHLNIALSSFERGCQVITTGSQNKDTLADTSSAITSTETKP